MSHRLRCEAAGCIRRLGVTKHTDLPGEPVLCPKHASDAVDALNRHN